jgi:hypothetical protein
MFIFSKFFDPDTYNYNSFKQLKKTVQLYDTYILISLLVCSFPLIVFIPYVLPRL